MDLVLIFATQVVLSVLSWQGLDSVQHHTLHPLLYFLFEEL